jgi:hypothetical protein
MNSLKRLLLAGAGTAALAFAVASCSDDSTGPQGTSHVQVLITDAPSDYIAEAVIWVSRVYLQGGGEDEAPRVDLFNDPDNAAEFDLLELRDGVTAQLTDAEEVDAGTYRQLRLVVDSAWVTLVEGASFTDGSTTMRLFVPSGAQSGIKVNLASNIEAEEGETTTIVVDFDVDMNFVIQGNPDTPAGITGILFTPVLQEKSRQTDED